MQCRAKHCKATSRSAMQITCKANKFEAIQSIAKQSKQINAKQNKAKPKKTKQ
jgi:hypothetical protein